MNATAMTETAPARKPSKPAPGFAAIGRSLLINVAGAWLAFKLVAPHYPEHSAAPLLASAAAPLLYMVWELVKRRMLDGVAVIQLTLSGLSAVTALVTHDEHASLAAIAFQPLGLGLLFGVTALLGHPLIATLARQAMAGDDAQAGANFDRAVKSIPEVRRRMGVISALWFAVLACETCVRLVMVRMMPASSYILAANIMGYAVPGTLVWLSMKLGDGLEAKLRAQGRLAPERAAS